ncbi:hypothetical protein GSI_10903 [Ganoderma sinense ZZ0214-1]|uniref:Uncharacterized protein n=1 Tax=Ganoderma sinense ZZ0214-1 TaxID=1077348 RepID=A0A2G8S1V0_9APHY|nr:hypothetical protein GSI_10903 [Ganoderma sinense ZZ0214-1]
MQDPSPERHSDYAPSYSVVPSNTDWLPILSLAPWSVNVVESVYPTERASHQWDTDLFDPLSVFDPHVYSDMHSSLVAEADQWLRPIVAEADANGFDERWHSSHLPSGHEETTREITAGDGPALDLDERGYEIIYQDPYRMGRRAAHIIPPIQYHGFSLNSTYKREYHDLSDADFPAWPAVVPVATKLSITFCVKLQAGNHDPLKHRGVDIALENLVLVDVQHVSKGSLQPTVGIIVKSN